MKTTIEYQCNKIKSILNTKGSITTREGIKLGILRTASRIFELRASGLKIKTIRMADFTAKYVLIK